MVVRAFSGDRWFWIQWRLVALCGATVGTAAVVAQGAKTYSKPSGDGGQNKSGTSDPHSGFKVYVYVHLTSLSPILIVCETEILIATDLAVSFLH